MISSTRAYRFGIALAVLTAFLLIWPRLGVGIIGIDVEAADLMCVLALAIGVAGAYLARFQVDATKRVLIAVAAMTQIGRSGILV